MRFIHCADLHLDSNMESNLSKEKAKLRRNELLDTFCNMAEYARENDVTAILIAGDLFDNSHVRKQAKNRVLDTIRAYHDVDFIYLKGNHDMDDFLYGLSEDELPSNLKTFSDSQWTSYQYDNVSINGIEITDQNEKTISINLVLDPEMVNIVMLHGQETNYTSMDITYMIPLAELRNKNIDYLALGHIHSYSINKLDERGEYSYSGCLEGRGFDECGPKGFVLLDIVDNQVDSKFIPFAKRTLHEVELLVTPEMNMPDIMAQLETIVSDISPDDIVKIVLNGKVAMETEIDLYRIKTYLIHNFFYGKVKDQTSVEIDYNSFANDKSLKGEFVRLLQDSDLPEETRSKIVNLGIRALMGEEIDLCD